ncbi:hypothetical protein COLO4_27030 [Corchorus olitorius]|uniref:Uncharacterized protein n=1 Tax=Corchorus olitorius TaxID=93759 RepID=A0A1R3HT22_9ROSI|nr:hypothetical protein COLO4_27030 [Corchorus olitorius]
MTWVAYICAVDTSDGGSFTQETQSPVSSVNAPAPETQLNDYTSLPTSFSSSPAPSSSEAVSDSFPESSDTTQDIFPSANPPNEETQTQESVPELNDYSSLPKSASPAPSEAAAVSSFPESSDQPTIEEMTPSSTSNDGTDFGLFAPSSHTILPSNYRAEDEPVEPYEEEENSGNGVTGAVAGVLASVCIVGVAGFVYQKKKNDNIRAQYTCLAKRGGV